MLLSFCGLSRMVRGRKRNMCSVSGFMFGKKNGGGVLFVLLWGFLLGCFVFLLYHGIKWEVLGRCTWGQGGQSTAKAV